MCHDIDLHDQPCACRSKHIVHAVDDGRNVVAAPVAVPLEPLEAELLSKMTPRTRAKFLVSVAPAHCSQQQLKFTFRIGI